MAYTVISQNNTTTTLADELGNVIHVPARVHLATSTDYTITKVNNSTATLEDGNGNVIRDVPCVAVLYGGDSGGDQHNLGYYATQAALEEAHPTAEAGDWAIVGATDTVWIWDEDTSAWVDSDQKGQVVSVNSKTGTVVLDALDVGAVPQVETMSTPTQEKIVQYIGATNATYTNGYFYKATGTTTYTDSTTFDPASISGTTTTATAGALAGLCAEYGSGDITTIIKGTLTYDQSSDLLVFVGLDDTDTQVCTFQLYTQDYTDAGFTFTGTLADGDVINFTTTISEVSTTYSWSRIDVQPAPEALPSQTGNAGKFLTTDGTDASWSDKPLVNTATHASAIAIDGTATAGNAIAIKGRANNIDSIAIGYYANCRANYGNCIGDSCTIGTFADFSIAIGRYAQVSNMAARSIVFGSGTASAQDSLILGNGVVTAQYAMQIGTVSRTNSDANTLKVGNNNGNFEMMSADGTIPTARLTKVNSTITLTSAGWSSNTQTVNVTGMTATGVVMVSPDPTDQSAYTSAGILCTAQASGTLTFTCDTVPSADIDVNVVML